ncbi:uncharacterized protein LOC128127967 [Lactuca sativa]|uniref:uncharacterized protein LOC128127967 n=1 Tax=Lactuca sativa TaxID=4236 RepID=UPI0022AFA6ED|nr:uncharacterized protein LOC128127967 [Lactuca sativa]
MADSSSVHDTSVRQPLLTIKPQQNLIIDLTPFVYELYMLYVVECLKYSPLVDALTKVEVVPMSFLSLVYSTAFYNKTNEHIHFELHDEKVSISKSRFCALIGRSQDQSLGLSERSAGSDGASKAFMTVLYGLYNGLNLDYGTIIWQQLVQSLVSSSKHSEISCGRFWTIITKWAMDRNRVPIMADSLLSSIATFHTTKIIVTDPTKFTYIGSIPETMLGCISASSKLLQQYRKRKSVGPRDLIPSMLRSIEEGDKPAKRGKKPESQKKPTRRLILQSSSDSDSEYVPPKQKNAPSSDSENESSDEEASGRGDTPPRSPTPEIPVRSLPSSPPSVTIPASIPPISQTTASQPFTSIPIPTPIFTNTTSTTTTKPTFTIPKPPATEPTFTTEPPHTTEPPRTTETPVTTEPPPSSKPLSQTPSTETTPILGGEDLEFDSTYFSPYRVQSEDDDDEPITKCHLKAINDKLDQLLSSSSSGAYSNVVLKALFSSLVAEHSASLSDAAKAIEASTSQCQQTSCAVDASTQECKEATTKVDKLVSDAHIFLDSLQAVAAKNAATVNSSVETLQSDCSKVEAARLAIEQANDKFHANVNERLTQLQADLAMENGIMDELAKRTTQLKLQTHKLQTATAKIDDLKSEREISSDKLRPTLDVLSRIEGVLVTGVQPQQGGEEVSNPKEKVQPPPSTSKPSAKPKDNVASVSNKEKKKKKIGDDDTDHEDDDVYAENPKNPFQKVKTSEKDLEESVKKHQAELEQKRKEVELLEKTKALFLVWTKDSLQRCAIDEPAILWLEPIISFSLDNSKDAQFDMPITRKAFIFHCFNSTAAIPSPDPKSFELITSSKEEEIPRIVVDQVFGDTQKFEKVTNEKGEHYLETNTVVYPNFKCTDDVIFPNQVFVTTGNVENIKPELKKMIEEDNSKTTEEDHAVDAEVHAPDNHIPEFAKLTDESTSTSQQSESMQNSPVEGEQLDSNTLNNEEHSFEGEKDQMNAKVEGEHVVEGEHNFDDACSNAGSENEEIYEDAPLEFDPSYPPTEKWTRDHLKDQNFIADYDDDSEGTMQAV